LQLWRITLAMFTHAYLTVVPARSISEAKADKQRKKRLARRKAEELIPLTTPEVRRLI